MFPFLRLLLCFFLFVVFTTTQANNIFKRTLKLMGSRFEITVVAEDREKADAYIDLAVDEISRIEQLISSWNANSQTSLINKNAGIKAVKVNEELIQLIERAVSISNLTDGAFDITYASIDKLWYFDGSMTAMPSPEKIATSVSKIGFQYLHIDKKNSTVFLEKKGMKIGFGAIGKGYAADQAKKLLMNKGVTAGIINASGDMNTWGKQPNGKFWEVAITNPLDKKKAFGLLPIKEGAVVTSGNYEKYVVFDNTRYSHIIDPRTGYPSTGILSVTVFAPKAELADALATSIFVMGKEAGINRVNQLSKVECIIIDENGDIYQSKNIQINTQ